MREMASIAFEGPRAQKYIENIFGRAEGIPE